ncbi:uncharacterized protein LOC143298624 [Babylonia areolata]|uniref:uncharacterized protein LOC143298624 n=1 Tax=Babylonia areolata TaxID=304850 RepID=UPI003FD2AB89
MAKAGEQKVGGDETCTGVGAGDPEVGANEPSRSTAEPVVNGAEKEHPSAKKRRVDRAENKCDESREEEETLVLPCVSSPQSRLRKKLEKRHKRSPQRSAQRAPSLAGSSQSEVEFQTLERTPRRRGQGQGQASAGVPSVRDTPSTNSTLLCPVTPPVHEFLLSASPVAKAGSLPCACEEKEKSGKHKGGKKVKRLTALGAVRALSHEFDLSLKEAQVLFWRNSGHVDATRYWIMTGYTLPGHYYWTEEEDGVLQTCQPDHPDWQRLEETYSLSAVLQRIQWLQDTAH